MLKELVSWVYSLVVSLAIALFINIFILQPSSVMGQSMEPTLHENQHIFLSKVSHAIGKLPVFGDIVVIDSRVQRERTWRDDVAEPVNNLITFVTGGNPGHNIWVKRVVGLPGDVLELKDDELYRNGQRLQEPYIKEQMITTGYKKIVVPAGHVFVMGDNRNNSSDSRMIGTVPADHVLGIMVFGI
jgi:signal peptidase I